MPLSREDSVAGGKRSGEVRRAKSLMKADQRAKQKFESAAEQMADILIRAALGKGEFSRIEPKDRAQFAQKVLEYAVGRPRQAAVEQEAPEAEAKGGISFTIGAPQGDMVAHPESDKD